MVSFSCQHHSCSCHVCASCIQLISQAYKQGLRRHKLARQTLLKHYFYVATEVLVKSNIQAYLLGSVQYLHQRMISDCPIILCKTDYHLSVNCHLNKNLPLNCIEKNVFFNLLQLGKYWVAKIMKVLFEGVHFIAITCQINSLWLRV